MQNSQSVTHFEAPRPDGTADDLYRLYLDFLSDARERVCFDVPAGPDRRQLLQDCQPLPREHFEARLERARHEPHRFSEIVDVLQAGYRGRPG